MTNFVNNKKGIDEINNRGYIETEKSNPRSRQLDNRSTKYLAYLFSKEDLIPQKAVENALPSIIEAIDRIYDRLDAGGRLFYLGAGTSGRLGVLDASECPPTFCTPPDFVQGIIAGGNKSLTTSSEELEDSTDLSINDLNSHLFSEFDCLVGITAGGTTPYVISALNHSNKIGALTISISSVPITQSEFSSDIDIRLLTGAELLTGSTRLKAATATKMTLNMISTIVMIKLGKVYDNKMVDVSVSNNKLLDRSIRIMQDLVDISREEAISILGETNGSLKISLLVKMANISISKANNLLELSKGNLRLALSKVKDKS